MTAREQQMVNYLASISSSLKDIAAGMRALNENTAAIAKSLKEVGDEEANSATKQVPLRLGIGGTIVGRAQMETDSDVNATIAEITLNPQVALHLFGEDNAAYSLGSDYKVDEAMETFRRLRMRTNGQDQEITQELREKEGPDAEERR